MSPGEISALTTLVTFLGKISGWPFGLLFFIVVIGPWVLACLLAFSYRNRHAAVVDMYEKNVRLVDRQESLSDDLKEIIVLNTQAMTRLVRSVETNQYCPYHRLEKKKEPRLSGVPT